MASQNRRQRLRLEADALVSDWVGDGLVARERASALAGRIARMMVESGNVGDLRAQLAAKDAEIAAARSAALTAAYQACEDRADLYRLAAEQTASAACERDLNEQARGARACAAAIRVLMEKPHA